MASPRQEEPARKIGAGHAEAMGRLGWKELRNALSWEARSVADTEIGLLGSATQGEISQGRSGETGLDAEEEKTSVLGYPLEQGPDPGQGRQQSRGR